MFSRASSPSAAPRVRTAITTSSSEQLPARSPMPLTATSICRAPASMPASAFATASPRSLWQCVEIDDVLGPDLAQDASSSPNSVGIA